MDFTQYLELLTSANFWIMVAELIIIPALLTGPKYGLVRFLNWVKAIAKLKDKTLLGIPVMRLVAGFFSVVAAVVGMIVDGTLRNVTPEPTAVITVAMAFFALSQSWFAILKSEVDLQKALSEKAMG
jgi:hypothetical protein